MKIRTTSTTVLAAALAVAGSMLLLASETWAQCGGPCFSGGPSVRVTPNVQVEFKWITNVTWFGEVAVFDNPDATGPPVLVQRDEDALGNAVAATQHTVTINVGPTLATDTGYFFRVTATDPNNSLPPFRTPAPLPLFFTGMQAISNVYVAPDITSAVISWAANVIGYGSVVYGTTGFDQGPVEDSFNITNHTIELTGLLPGTTYQFRVSNKHAIDDTSLADATGQFTTHTPTSVEDLGPADGGSALLPPFPNPSPGPTQLSFRLEDPGSVQIEIFDLAGRRVRSLVHGQVPAGLHSVAWDGRTDSGRAVGSGLYFVEFSSPHGRATGRVTLVR